MYTGFERATPFSAKKHIKEAHSTCLLHEMARRIALAIAQHFFLLAEQVADFAGIKYTHDEDVSVVNKASHAVSSLLPEAVNTVDASVPSLPPSLASALAWETDFSWRDITGLRIILVLLPVTGSGAGM